MVAAWNFVCGRFTLKRAENYWLYWLLVALVISKPPKGKELSKKGGSNVELAKFRDKISPVKKLFMFWNDKNTDLRCFYHFVLKNVQALLSNITFF